VRRPSLAAIAAIVSLAAPAFAQPSTEQSHLALAQPTAPETLPVAAVRQIVFRVAEGLVEAGLDVSVDPFPGGACTGADCIRDMARAHDANAVLMTRITSEGQTYRVRVELVDGSTGQPVGNVQRTCNFCAYDELATTALEATRTLLREQHERQNAPRRRPPLRLVHRSTRGPAGAAWAAVTLGVASIAAGAVLLAVERNEPEARGPAVAVIAAGALLAGGGGAVLLFWPQPDNRGRFVGATAAVRVAF
jgi:hypothetical protein